MVAWRGKLKSRRWGAYQNVQLGKVASAEGAKLRLLRARSPLATRGMVERRKLPRGVWGSPETKAILSISCQNWVHFGILQISDCLTIKSKKADERNFDYLEARFIKQLLCCTGSFSSWDTGGGVVCMYVFMHQCLYISVCIMHA